MRFSTIGLPTATVGLCLALTCSARTGEATFHLIGYEATPKYTGLRFENGKHEWRSVVFMDGKSGGFAIEAPGVKGILEWSDVTDIRLTPSKSNSELSLSVVEYVDYYDHSRRTFEMGLIDDSRLNDLKRRYDHHLNFVTSKSEGTAKVDR